MVIEPDSPLGLEQIWIIRSSLTGTACPSICTPSQKQQICQRGVSGSRHDASGWSNSSSLKQPPPFLASITRAPRSVNQSICASVLPTTLVEMEIRSSRFSSYFKGLKRRERSTDHWLKPSTVSSRSVHYLTCYIPFVQSGTPVQSNTLLPLDSQPSGFQSLSELKISFK